ncbi:hypothetical protein J2W98_000486 [Paenibacillus peoriae]|uniref:Uncharacterized protein n=1 Tax=Paenibacillus peoriae TaxID=59893 RepID=A0ABU1QAI4_9BACL|nr:hypothetical protein [Paenibacillus peoriae]MDR6776239.1 hypothetical protein [Paenibacillus peoriae]
MSILLFFLVTSLLVFQLLRLFIWKSFNNLITKIILRYFLFSLIIIVTFAACYFIVSLFDIVHIVNEKQNVSGTKLQVSDLKNAVYIHHINYTLYKSNKSEFFFQFINISASSYFNLNSNHTFFGIAQFIQYVERALAIITPLLIILVTTVKEFDVKNKEILNAFLHRGWDILLVQESEIIRERFKVTLIKGVEIKNISVDSLSSLKKMIQAFKYDWSKVTIETAPFFARLLESPLRKEDYDLAYNAFEFYRGPGEDKQEFYVKYYKFLCEARLKISLLNSDIDYEDFDYVLSIVRKNVDDKSQLIIYPKTEVSENE